MNGYTGTLFEEEVVGRCLWDRTGYVPFRKAMAIVKRFQPGNPSQPSSRAMNDFHDMVCEELGEKDYPSVKIYTAVGSPLDRFHGIDAFIEWNGAVVTIDLTVNSKKDEHKADIILHEEDVYTEDGEVNQVRLLDVAQRSVRLLRCGARTVSRQIEPARQPVMVPARRMVVVR